MGKEAAKPVSLAARRGNTNWAGRTAVSVSNQKFLMPFYGLA
jgi:hypothetical protein